ncbi:MAG: tRNA preQ1(34) S-adenosylmethionine ribosyltransferase-isomerase QueA [Ktedonobacterales bacterium]|nr:tRNA preQ1(34) S-adenosylmethionine ribosyltransferase-isomerase QueA [Ktedonobacterales bacterium]
MDGAGEAPGGDITDLNSVAAYDYHLPPDQIAQTPAEPRDSSRLLVLNRATGSLTHSHFRDIGQFLHAGDLLVANESRVLPARLHGTKAATGARVEILLLALRPERGPTTWEALVKPGKRVRPGHRVSFPQGLVAEITDTTPTEGRIVRFTVDGQPDPALVEARLRAIGEMPLPPYIRTKLDDPERYQTVYSHTEGSAAAPTAGLHFTPELIAQLDGEGIAMAKVTLHVGLDTFRPVEVADLRQHHLHSEAIALDRVAADAINATHARGGRVIAVGTTTVRTLESVAQRGVPLQPYTGPTEIFITPGFAFRATDALITNFHLPRSTLLAMISAFAGRDLVMQAYAVAIAAGYRFYSFGDAMLIL